VRLGVGRIEDFTWKGLLDFSTCTECGRCQDLCPAWNTGKPLSPKLFVMALRDHHAAAAPYLRAANALGVEPDDVTEEMVASRPTSGGLVGKALGMHDGLARETNLGLEPGTAHTGGIISAAAIIMILLSLFIIGSGLLYLFLLSLLPVGERIKRHPRQRDFLPLLGLQECLGTTKPNAGNIRPTCPHDC